MANFLYNFTILSLLSTVTIAANGGPPQSNYNGNKLQIKSAVNKLLEKAEKDKIISASQVIKLELALEQVLEEYSSVYMNMQDKEGKDTFKEDRGEEKVTQDSLKDNKQDDETPSLLSSIIQWLMDYSYIAITLGITIVLQQKTGNDNSDMVGAINIVTGLCGVAGIVCASGQLFAIISISLMPYAIPEIIKLLRNQGRDNNQVLVNNQALVTNGAILISALLYFLLYGPLPFIGFILVHSVSRFVNDVILPHLPTEKKKGEFMVWFSISLLLVGRVTETIFGSLLFYIWFYAYGSLAYIAEVPNYQTANEGQPQPPKDCYQILKDLLQSWPNMTTVNQEDMDTLILLGIKFIAPVGLLMLVNDNIGLVAPLICIICVSVHIRDRSRESEEEKNFFLWSQLAMAGMMFLLYITCNHWTFICIGAIGLPCTNAALQLIDEFHVYRVKSVQCVGVLASFGLSWICDSVLMYFISCALLGLFLYTMINDHMTPTAVCGLIISAMAVASMYSEVMIIGIIGISAQFIVLKTNIKTSTSTDSTSQDRDNSPNSPHATVPTNTVKLECSICVTDQVQCPVISSCCDRIIGCKECVERWIRRQPRCPMCNTQANAGDFREVKGIN